MTTKHPIIALWGHPRSMSTATERVMRERGDLTVFHEPFMADYYMHRAGRVFPMVDTSDPAWVDYKTARARILTAADAGPVFFKDIAYYVNGVLQQDPDFARRLTHVFLVRDPRRAIASYWKLDPEMTCEEIGLEAQWHVLSWLSAQGIPTLVVEAEAISADPKVWIGRIWERAGLGFVDDAFSWQAGSMPLDWQRVAGWHEKAAGSSGIRPDSSDPQALFDQAAARAPHLSGFLDHHWPFYEKLRDLA